MTALLGRRGRRGVGAGRGGAHRHVPFAAIARRPPDIEPRITQGLAQFAGAGPGGHRSLRRGQPRQVLEQGGLPHARIALRRETIQEIRVDPRRKPRRQRLRIAETERQRHRAALEFQPVQAGQQGRPLRRQLRRQRGQGLGRMARQQGLQVRPAERVRLQRHHVQGARALRIIAPRAPQRQEIEPQAETGLADREGAASAPAFRQAVAAQENVFGLAQRARRRVVHVAIGRAIEPALRIEFSDRGGQGHVGRRHGNGGDRKRWIIGWRGRLRWMRATGVRAFAAPPRI
ncbi:hypothetical protein LMG26845_04232 [Achromobacter insuavis]|uniref:Uncharacterized protein n=1 Tax=Achromobacter insuavis TaxID=1287735 RepID=A0A6J5AVA3_9BURK|nr:hypothetical protein LMG26845_04232 [Achromobacter insuavis]